MNLNKIAKACMSLFFMAAGISASGQDLIARQAPVDRKLKTADSVSLQRLIEHEREVTIANIYPNWDNELRRQYAEVSLPDSFQIDLRNFCMPTPSRLVTSNYGYRRRFRRMHRGLDVKVYPGDTIRAAFDGKVRIVKFDAGGYGKYVMIRHPNGLETIYGHLSKQLVNEEQDVKAGDIIGLGGSTGLSTGSHLHFEILLLGQAINPVLLFDFPNQDVTGDFYMWYKDEKLRTGLASKESEDDKNSSSAVGYHKVRSGENLSVIANKHRVSIAQLCRINRITRHTKLRVGQILKYTK